MSKERVVAITQARMNSQRLPGKVLLEVASRPLLQHHLERVRRAETLDEVVVATTVNATDDPIVELCRELDVRCVRGPEVDVLGRYVLAAKASAATTVVRVTSDCPMIDPGIIDLTVNGFLSAAPDVDYASNRLVQTFPRGLDTEVLSAALLTEVDREATQGADREHVTLFVWRQPERFRLLNVPFGKDASDHRWTVDTPEDFELIRRMIEACEDEYGAYRLEDALGIADRHPKWREINENVQQKTVI